MLQVTLGGLTALMIAALNRSVKVLDILLEKNADVDIISPGGETALEWAIHSEDEKIIDKLCVLTKSVAGIPNIVRAVAWRKVKITGELSRYIREAVKNDELCVLAIKTAAKFGAVDLLEVLIKDKKNMDKLSREVKEEILENAVKADSIDMVKMMSNLCGKSVKICEIAEKRGVTKIVDFLKMNEEKTLEEKKENLMRSIKPSDSGISIPKMKEYEYTSKSDKLSKVLKKENPVSYKRLLEELQVPEVHVGENIKNCPEECLQKKACGQIREIYKCVEMIVEELAKRDERFVGMTITLIGSLREGEDISLKLDCHNF